MIEESIDGTTYTELYHSQTAEAIKIYTPATAGVKSIRITLKDSTDTYTYDYQTVAVLLDAEALAEVVGDLSETVETQGTQLSEAQSAITTHTTKIGGLETSINGMQETLLEMTTQIEGVIGGDREFQVTWVAGEDNTTTLSAHLYEIDPETKKQTEITNDYPDIFYWWVRRSETDIDETIASGKTVTVNNEDCGFNGEITGCFYPFETAYLTTRSGKILTTRAGSRLTTFTY